MGWTLEKSETIESDLVLIGGELNLNGHDLYIKGNLNHYCGTINLNGGTLIVDGNYKSVNENLSYGSYDYQKALCIGHLKMNQQSDKMIVKGDFICGYWMGVSPNEGDLTDGELSVEGDLRVFKGQYSFIPRKNHTLILNGTAKQEIFNPSSTVCYGEIQNLEILNSAKVQKDGIEQSAISLHSKALVKGHVKDNGNDIGQICISDCTTFEDGKSASSIYGCNLEVGSVSFSGGSLYVDGGILNCLGEMEFNSTNGLSALYMVNSNDIVNVGGNFTYSGYTEDGRLTDGVLTLYGNFTQNTYGNQTGNFRATGNHKTIFAGTKKQIIYFDSTDSYFNIVELRNQSNSIQCNSSLNAYEVIRNGCNIEFANNGICGWTLTEDTTIEGDCYLCYEDLDLNGHTLTINGDLIQGYGQVKINGGKLFVNGDYRSING